MDGRHAARWAAALGLTALGTWPAAGQGRPDTTRLSCAGANALVRERGAVVLSTGPVAYERVVAHGGFCEADTTPVPDYLRTADERSCFVGYRCKDLSRDVESRSQ